ncbi:hypothetical protein EAG_07298 [Camponotus floridanus]|uniref:Retrotransposon gag domain-containing protein n=1 Tax=Camponotus floridanus TaxID=104421 RepID=E2ATK7_CAMFO|nr:hypothetical protein EAG_07298 [Camponotus floridanus]
MREAQQRGHIEDERVKATSVASESTSSQVQSMRLLKTTFKLDDSQAKLLMGSRLKEKASEWFHSKPELIDAQFDDFLTQLRGIHRERPVWPR